MGWRGDTVAAGEGLSDTSYHNRFDTSYHTTIRQTTRQCNPGTGEGGERIVLERGPGN